MTQQEVADLLNVSRQTYNNYESSVLKLDLETCLNILHRLNATEQEIDEFFNAIKQDYMSYKEV
jgi:DNA-binding XRE family transcriptional regulator